MRVLHDFQSRVLMSINAINALRNMVHTSFLYRRPFLFMEKRAIHDLQNKEKYMSLINTQIKPFKAQAYHNGQFITVTDNDLKGKWLSLIHI